MANANYLRFNADSMANALKNKLGQNSSFTDQIYAGSDLAILIEKLSYLYEQQVFLLNNAGSDAIFTDSKLYENMNRIVKMIGYNPVGHIPAQVVLGINNKRGITTAFFSDETKWLPKYTSINTNLSDSNGKSIYYTFTENIDIYTSNTDSSTSKYNAINGKWKLLNTTLIAYGTANETFTLNSLDLSSTYLAHNYINVYVKRFENGQFVYKEFYALQNGFTYSTTQSIIGSSDQVFELRINENKKYELVFGDGIHGVTLKKNDELYVVYLESNGQDGEIGANIIQQDCPINIGIDGLSRELLCYFLGTTLQDYSNQYVSDSGSNNELARFYFFNPKSSTKFTLMETVDDIRQNAPFWFKTNGVLLQEKDYKRWFLSGSYKNLFYDVSIMNNETYIKRFMGWLDSYDKLTLDIRKSNYPYSDACDFNKIYIWVKQKYDVDFDPIYDELEKRKVLTSKPIIMNCVTKFFTPGIFFQIDDMRVDGGKYYTQGVFKNLNGSYYIDETLFQTNPDNWIEIIKDKTTFVSSEKIKQNVMNEIKRFFEPQNNKMGEVVNLNQLYINLINIPGVKNVRTCFRNNVLGRPVSETYYYNGISFIAYTKAIMLGADIEIVQGSQKLQDFQFPQLGFEKYLSDKIFVISESNQSNINM